MNRGPRGSHRSELDFSAEIRPHGKHGAPRDSHVPHGLTPAEMRERRLPHRPAATDSTRSGPGRGVIKILEEYCREKGRDDAAKKVPRKVMVELLLNRLQAFREAHPALPLRAAAGLAAAAIRMLF